jgi:hypothetical protein
MQKYLIAAAIFLLILFGFAINAAFDARALLYSYRSENAYLRSQLEAKQRDINYLTDQYFEMREMMRRK